MRARAGAEPVLQLADGSVRRHLPHGQAESARKGRILFINAVNEVTRERAQSFLTDDHIERIVKAYEKFKDEPGFTRVADAGANPREGWKSQHPALCGHHAQQHTCGS